MDPEGDAILVIDHFWACGDIRGRDVSIVGEHNYTRYDAYRYRVEREMKRRGERARREMGVLEKHEKVKAEAKEK